MRILIHVDSLIGRSLCQLWQAEGHELYVWSRSPTRSKTYVEHMHGRARS